MGRIIAIDYGHKRVGLAVTDLILALAKELEKPTKMVRKVAERAVSKLIEFEWLFKFVISYLVKEQDKCQKVLKSVEVSDI